MSRDNLRLFLFQSDGRPVIDQASDGPNILTHRGLTCDGSGNQLATMMRQGYGGGPAETVRLNRLNDEVLRLAGEATRGLSDNMRIMVDIPLNGRPSPLETACQQQRARRR